MIFAWKERLALEHLREYASCTPYVNLDVIFLPCEHDFRGAIIAGRDVARHLGVLDSGETEIADLQVAIFIDQDVAWFEVAVNDTC